MEINFYQQLFYLCYMYNDYLVVFTDILIRILFSFVNNLDIVCVV